ncbi:MAG: MFS transporter [Thaumarchaeota archaeon]|nr:MFS transporter [Nitrososphaerota archaeon]MCL5317023.1 MFS transporter [Nitrososphaerota archaeon]
MLYIAAFIIRVGFGVIIIALPRYVVADSFTTGLVLAVYPVLEAISAAPVGMYVDRHGRKKIMLAGLVSMTLFTFLIGLSRNTAFIAAVHGVMGFSAAAVTVSTLTMITDLTRKSDRGAGMGVFDLSNIGGYAGGILVGTWLYTMFEANPAYVFYSTSLILLAASAAVLMFLAEPLHELQRGPLSLNFIKNLSWNVKSLLPIWFALTTLLGITFFIPKALSEAGFSTGSSGLLLFGAAAGMGIGAILFGRISDKIGREKTVLIGVVGMLALLPALAFALSPKTNSAYPGFGIYISIIGPAALLTSALIPSILALVGDTTKTTLRGSAMGLYSVMLSLGLAIGNIVGGYFNQIGGLVTVLNVGEAIFVAALVASFTIHRLKRNQLQEHNPPLPEPTTNADGARNILSLSYWMRFIRFNIVGFTGIFVNEGLLILLTAGGMYYLYASAIAVEASILGNFILHDIWTFKDRRHGHIMARLMRFNGLMLVGLGINLVILYALTEFFGVNYLVSNLVGIMVASVARYSMSVRWGWLHKKTTDVMNEPSDSAAPSQN